MRDHHAVQSAGRLTRVITRIYDQKLRRAGLEIVSLKEAFDFIPSARTCRRSREVARRSNAKFAGWVNGVST
jgi:hypothetical protein